jgi:asparagine synthetase B (glutamine-hydrolysing)
VSALAGWWSLGAGDPAAEVSRLLGLQRAQGPDGAEQAAEGPVALGRALRWRVPEDAHDAGPVQLRGGKGWVVADARLDNRAELEGWMRIDPVRAQRMSDAAILATGIERWGESAVERIVGDYAFAWWDAPGERLVLGRDFLGTRPLMLVRGQGHAAFASVLEGGEAVPPGHVVTVTANGASMRRWWRPQARALGLAGVAEHAEALEQRIEVAVRSRLRGAGDAVAVIDTGDPASAAVIAAARGLMPADRLKVIGPDDDGIEFDVVLAPRLGALTIGYAGTEHLPPALAKPPLLGVAHLLPGVASRARAARLAAFEGLDLAESMAPGEGPDVRDPTADRRLVEFCLSVPEKIWAKGLAKAR